VHNSGVTERTVDLQHENSPRINFFFVEFHVVIVIWQALAEAAKALRVYP
jgi:hypothetical protein